jgi:hypothetical protein
MKKLDKNKPYGQITGCTEGRVYEQDGVYFNGDGTEWEATDVAIKVDEHGMSVPTEDHPSVKKTVAKKAPAKPAAKAAVKPVKAVSPVDSQLNDQLKG